METVKFHKTKAHQTYRLQDGTKVPGCSTVLEVIPAPGLMHWAWQCGMDGIDFRKARDQAGEIGTITHWLCECFIRNQTPDLSPFSAEDIEVAQRSFENFRAFWERNNFVPYPVNGSANEIQLVSELHGYGGTIDFLVWCHNTEEIVLVDFKTSKGIYDKYWFQLAGYKNLVEEATGNTVGRGVIVRIGKRSEDDFEVIERTPGQMKRDFEVFKSALHLHKLLGSYK